jgi:uncharacterized protein YbcI
MERMEQSAVDEAVRPSVRADLSRAMVSLHKECYGKGPTKARTVIDGDVVVCILEGGFAKAELTLRDSGRADAVVQEREALQQALRGRFVGTVEALTARSVRTFISGIDLARETSAEVFVLEPTAGGGREAFEAWT